MRSIQELEAIREKTLESMTLRKEHNGTRIAVGMATCGIAAGARNVLSAFMQELSEKKLIHVALTQTGCIGMCHLEPIVEVHCPNEETVTYIKVTSEMAKRIVAEHIELGKPIEEYTIEHYNAKYTK